MPGPGKVKHAPNFAESGLEGAKSCFPHQRVPGPHALMAPTDNSIRPGAPAIATASTPSPDLLVIHTRAKPRAG